MPRERFSANSSSIAAACALHVPPAVHNEATCARHTATATTSGTYSGRQGVDLMLAVVHLCLLVHRFHALRLRVVALDRNFDLDTCTAVRGVALAPVYHVFRAPENTAALPPTTNQARAHKHTHTHTHTPPPHAHRPSFHVQPARGTQLDPTSFAWQMCPRFGCRRPLE